MGPIQPLMGPIKRTLLTWSRMTPYRTSRLRSRRRWTLRPSDSDSHSVGNSSRTDTLSDYNIQKYYTLHLSDLTDLSLRQDPQPSGTGNSFSINVGTPTGEKDLILLDVEEKDTILDVKKKIQKEIGKLPWQQRLTFDGTALVDNETVKHYKIENGFWIYLILLAPVPDRLMRSITVAGTIDGNTIQMTLETDGTIQNVKPKIQEKFGISPEQQRLLYNGKELENGRLLSYYNRKDEVSGSTCPVSRSRQVDGESGDFWMRPTELLWKHPEL